MAITEGMEQGPYRVLNLIRVGLWLVECRTCKARREIKYQQLATSLSRLCSECRAIDHGFKSGHVVGAWTLIDRLPAARWKCRCTCGRVVGVRSRDLAERKPGRMLCGVCRRKQQSVVTVPRKGHGLDKLMDELADDADLGPPPPRPTTRGECENGPRPCPWVSCKHHLYLDVNPRNGSIKLNFGAVELEDLKETCSLDIAERGEHSLIEVGDMILLSRERVRQLEAVALKKVMDSDEYTFRP